MRSKSNAQVKRSSCASRRVKGNYGKSKASGFTGRESRCPPLSVRPRSGGYGRQELALRTVISAVKTESAVSKIVRAVPELLYPETQVRGQGTPRGSGVWGRSRKHGQARPRDGRRKQAGDGRHYCRRSVSSGGRLRIQQVSSLDL